MGSVIASVALYVPCAWQLSAGLLVLFALNVLIETIKYGVWRTSGRAVPGSWGTWLGLTATAIWFIIACVNDRFGGAGWSFGPAWCWPFWFIIGYFIQFKLMKPFSKLILKPFYGNEGCMHPHPEGEECSPEAAAATTTKNRAIRSGKDKLKAIQKGFKECHKKGLLTQSDYEAYDNGTLTLERINVLLGKADSANTSASNANVSSTQTETFSATVSVGV